MGPCREVLCPKQGLSVYGEREEPTLVVWVLALSHHWSEPCDSQRAAFQVAKHGLVPWGGLCARTVSKEQSKIFPHVSDC